MNHREEIVAAYESAREAIDALQEKCEAAIKAGEGYGPGWSATIQIRREDALYDLERMCCIAGVEV